MSAGYQTRKLHALGKGTICDRLTAHCYAKAGITVLVRLGEDRKLYIKAKDLVEYYLARSYAINEFSFAKKNVVQDEIEA